MLPSKGDIYLCGGAKQTKAERPVQLDIEGKEAKPPRDYREPVTWLALLFSPEGKLSLVAEMGRKSYPPVSDLGSAKWEVGFDSVAMEHVFHGSEDKHGPYPATITSNGPYLGVALLGSNL